MGGHSKPNFFLKQIEFDGVEVFYHTSYIVHNGTESRNFYIYLVLIVDVILLFTRKTFKKSDDRCR